MRNKFKKSLSLFILIPCLMFKPVPVEAFALTLTLGSFFAIACELVVSTAIVAYSAKTVSDSVFNYCNAVQNCTAAIDITSMFDFKKYSKITTEEELISQAGLSVFDAKIINDEYKSYKNLSSGKISYNEGFFRVVSNDVKTKTKFYSKPDTTGLPSFEHLISYFGGEYYLLIDLSSSWGFTVFNDEVTSYSQSNGSAVFYIGPKTVSSGTSYWYNWKISRNATSFVSDGFSDSASRKYQFPITSTCYTNCKSLSDALTNLGVNNAYHEVKEVPVSDLPLEIPSGFVVTDDLVNGYVTVQDSLVGQVVSGDVVIGDSVVAPPVNPPFELPDIFSISLDKIGGVSIENEKTFNFQPLLALGENITNKFPFSLPWDLIGIFKLFDAPPIAPKFDVDFKGTNIVVLDLSQFDSVIKIFRFFMLLYFIGGLIKITGTLTKH